MMKKIFNTTCFIEFLLAIVLYFMINYAFENDPYIYRALASTKMDATLMRLSIYLVPGVYIIGSIFGLIFENKKLLVFMGVIEVIIAFVFQGAFYKNDGLNTLSNILIIISIIHIISCLLIKTKKIS